MKQHKSKNNHKHGSERQRQAANSAKEPWYYKLERWSFLPIRVEADWNHEQDIREYVARFGESDDPLRDTQPRIAQNYTDLNGVLAAGINYFLKKRGEVSYMAITSLSLREKVALFTELLPDSHDTNYVLRFTTALGRLLWLESEHSRLLAQRKHQCWLYPLYHLADCIASTAFELEESLVCEHDDFPRISGREIEGDNGIAEERV